MKFNHCRIVDVKDFNFIIVLMKHVELQSENDNIQLFE